MTNSRVIRHKWGMSMSIVRMINASGKRHHKVNQSSSNDCSSNRIVVGGATQNSLKYEDMEERPLISLDIL